MDVTYYKTLDERGRGVYSGTQWHLPQDNQPGEWMPEVTGGLIMCKNGYHAATRGQIAQWLGSRIFEVEFEGEVQHYSNKVAGRKARLVREYKTWNSRTQRLFAADCAERVLSSYEQAYPGDTRVRDCIEVARRYARGEATDEERNAAHDGSLAAGVFTRPAAEAAAEAAASAATWAARATVRAARDAAEAAAEAAASAATWAARDAARDAARKTECEWQAERLCEYLEGVTE